MLNMLKRWSPFFISCVATIIILHSQSSCTSRQVRDTAEISLTVADDVCKEISQESPNEWVTLTCIIGNAIGQQILVRLPRAEWQSIRARTKRVTPYNQ
jgi:hypothetical protein